MIARSESTWQSAQWQLELSRAVRNLDELLRLLELPADLPVASPAAAADFALRVPRPFVARMRRGDAHDPLLLQVLAQAEETRSVAGFHTDPVGDHAAMVAPGVLHKYHGRVLLVATGACAVHCRYCFRRHFPYAQAHAGRGAWAGALDYLRRTESVTEVILSGGDPLILTDENLADLVAALEDIPHLRRLRIHTRLPIVLPQRVDARLLEWLTGSRLAPVMVLHSNHANEIDDAVCTALARLRAAGVPLFNQAVLLRGVNDTEQALADLSEALFAAGVMPYYLHLLDRVEGAGHFEVPAARARTLMEGLRARLPGYLVPRLVREDAGARAKTPL